MTQLGLIPHDSRPVSFGQVTRFLRSVGVSLLVPPLRLLGHRDQGDPEPILAWFEEHHAAASRWVLSLDMLVHGGLVPSRTPGDGTVARFARLSHLAGVAPEDSWYLFQSVRRTAGSTLCAADLEAWRAGHLDGAADPARDASRAGNLEAIALARSPAVRVLALLQEDSVPSAELAAEHDSLAAAAVGAPVVITAGCDEGVWTLGARAVVEADPSRCAADLLSLDSTLSDPTASDPAAADPDPPEVRPSAPVPLRWIVPVVSSGELCDRPESLSVIAPYEDRPLVETLRGQAAVVCASVIPIAESLGPAPTIFLWAPPRPALDRWLGGPAPGTSGGPARGDVDTELKRFVTGVEAAMDAGIPVVIADVADANGADPALMEALHAAGLLTELHGFAAWNTAGNTLGCALAQALLPRSHEGLRLRLLDDWGYQSNVRAGARKWAEGERRDDPWKLAEAARVETYAERRLSQWWREHLAAPTFGVPPEGGWVRIPWERLFEVDLLPEGNR